MTACHPISTWIRATKQGDAVAAGRICQYYFEEIVAVGRTCLRNTSNRACDEYDAANSVFRTFWRRAAAGQFPQLCDRTGLWSLLVVITVRKSLKQSRKENLRAPVDASQGIVDRIPCRIAAVDLRCAIEDTVEQICRKQRDPLLRDVFTYKCHGFTVQEIADRIGRSKPTVERKLRLIRTAIAEEFLD